MNKLENIGSPGKTCQLATVTARCLHAGMQVIFVDIGHRDFWLSAALPCALPFDGKAGISQRVLAHERYNVACSGIVGTGMTMNRLHSDGSEKENQNEQ